ncbi:hypothetical protein FO519_010192, partial [Halicephalobus sp. NKZ332]
IHPRTLRVRMMKKNPGVKMLLSTTVSSSLRNVAPISQILACQKYQSHWDDSEEPGESYFRQNNHGVLLLKWKDKRDIFMLSTKHDGSWNNERKPLVVEDYNKMKGFVDLSDQMAAYTPFVRKTAKWYMRLFFHLVTQTALVNAWILYTQRNSIQFNDFKIDIARKLMDLEENSSPSQAKKRKLIERSDLKGNQRRYCRSCYRKLADQHGRTHAKTYARKSRTQCSVCQCFICLECFQTRHKSCSSP